MTLMDRNAAALRGIIDDIRGKSAITGYLDADGVVVADARVNGEDDQLWCRWEENSRAKFRAWNNGRFIVSAVIPNRRVRVARNQAGEWEIIGGDSQRAHDDEGDAALYTLQPDNSSPFNTLPGRGFIPGRLRAWTAGTLKVNCEAFWYYDTNSAHQRWEPHPDPNDPDDATENSLNLAASVPATARTARWVDISFNNDAASPALVATNGAEVSIYESDVDDPLRIESITRPAGNIPIAAVLLYATDTDDGDLSPNDFHDTRVYFQDPTGGVSSTTLPAFGAGVVKTISGGVAAAGSDRHLVLAAETGTSDDLIEVSGLAVGEEAVLRADSGDTITVKHNDAGATDKLLLYNAADMALSGDKTLKVIKTSSGKVVQYVDEKGSGGAGAWPDVVVQRLSGTNALDDEFDDGSLDAAWTLVKPAAATVSPTEGGSVLSVKASGAPAANLCAYLKDITSLSAPVTIETAVRMLFPAPGEAPHIGLGFTDGTTHASAKALSGLTFWTTAAGTYYLRSYSSSAMTTVTAITTQVLSIFPTFVLYLKLVWNSANSWSFYFSPDGVSWLTNNASISFTMTPTHAGVFFTNYGHAGDHIFTFEYFRVTS